MSYAICQIKYKTPTRKDWLSSGFTLIELLVGLTIMALLFSAGFASFREFSRRQSLEAVVRTVKGDLRIAQGEALSGKKPLTDPTNQCGCPSSIPGCLSTNYLSGYNFTVSATKYDIQAVCSTGVVITTKTVDLSSLDVTITVPSLNPVFFKVRGEGTNIGTTPVTIAISQAKTGLTQSITVTNGGEIK